MWEHLGTPSWAQREYRMPASLEENHARGLQPGPLQVVQKIKASGNQVLLAVLDGDSYEAAKALGRDLSQMLPADIRPRLCHITRDKSGFGFSVSGPEGREAAGTGSLQHHPTWSIAPHAAACSSCRRQGHVPAISAAGRAGGESWSAIRFLAPGAEWAQRQELLAHPAGPKGACVCVCVCALVLGTGLGLVVVLSIMRVSSS